MACTIPQRLDKTIALGDKSFRSKKFIPRHHCRRMLAVLQPLGQGFCKRQAIRSSSLSLMMQPISWNPHRSQVAYLMYILISASILQATFLLFPKGLRFDISTQVDVGSTCPLRLLLPCGCGCGCSSGSGSDPIRSVCSSVWGWYAVVYRRIVLSIH